MAILHPLQIREEKIENSKFRLAHIASQRAKMIMQGAKPLVETSYKKPVTIALQEIHERKVSFYEAEEAARIREELIRRAREKEEAEARAIREKEDAARMPKESQNDVEESA